MADITDKIKHVFVLMFENRSFDHMLGFSRITGKDLNGNPTTINGLEGTESNTYQGNTYTVSSPAPYTMSFDPGHEFEDVVVQLAGEGATYLGGDYPPINSSGYIASAINSPKATGQNVGDVMKCFSPDQLPILVTLAKKYAVCDNWFSSMPGPTWPNRFFAMAATSGGMDSSPSGGTISGWEYVNKGYVFENGNIFSAIDGMPNAGGGAKIYNDYRANHLGAIPIAGALKGIRQDQIKTIDQFVTDIGQSSYGFPLTFLEPDYGDIMNDSYSNGSSQHPMSDIREGEKLIQKVYEAIRNSPHWESSLLIITYDEHGGFYDHVVPPKTVPPGDTPQVPNQSVNHFTFNQLGVRVPAVIVSPWIPENTIDNTLYDHATIAKTLEDVFPDMMSLTDRSEHANSLAHLISLDEARTDEFQFPPIPVQFSNSIEIPVPNLNVPIPERGNLNGFIEIALKLELESSRTEEHPAIISKVKNLETRQDAVHYLSSIQAKIFGEV